jgi:large subunit ribosomal protein L24e
MYVKKDGTVMLFCTNKCSKNMIDMKRVPRRVTWTRAYAREKDVRMKGPETEAKLLRKEAKKAAKAAALKPEVKPIEAPPLSTSADAVADAIVRGLRRRSEVV